MGSVRDAPAQAPGGLRVAQAFVNTHYGEGRHQREALGSAEATRSWLVRHGLLVDDARISEGDVRRTRGAREALRTLLRANTPARQHTSVPQASESAVSGAAAVTPDQIAEARETLNAIAAYAPLTVRFRGADRATLEPDIAGVDGALARLLAIVALAQADGSWSQLKVCANEACGAAFYDTSKNHSGVWCAMGRCGNRVNARASRARRRNVTNVTVDGAREES